MSGTLLASLSAFKTYKTIPSDNTREDDAITEMLNAASDFIKEYCQRTFIDNYDEKKIEYFDGSSLCTRYLSEYPLFKMDKVEFSTDGGKTYTEVFEYEAYYLGEDYITSGSSSALCNPFIKHNAIKLTYKAGFETVPRDLKLACMDLAEYFRSTQYNPKSSLGTNMVERSNKDGADVTKLPAHIYRVLNNYRTIG